jgi:hypothetical protein
MVSQNFSEQAAKALRFQYFSRWSKSISQLGLLP